MRWIYRCIGWVFVSLILQSCASPKMSQELTQGKVNFVEGNYKKAFHNLMPLAVSGNAQAEYAVGFMYYYGYGVAQDNESGLFWIEKSASQQFPPAVKALKSIREKPPIKKTVYHAKNRDEGYLDLTLNAVPEPLKIASETNQDEVMSAMLAANNVKAPSVPLKQKVQTIPFKTGSPPSKLPAIKARLAEKPALFATQKKPLLAKKPPAKILIKMNLKKSTCRWTSKNQKNNPLLMTRVSYAGLTS